jgi:hypothetical protein
MSDKVETLLSLVDQANAELEATRSVAAVYAAHLVERDRLFAAALALILEDPIDYEALADLYTTQAALLTREAARLNDLAARARAAAAELGMKARERGNGRDN